MAVAYIGLGSNLSDPIAQIQSAFKELSQIDNSKLLKQSSLYRSPPMGPPDQPDYINAVAAIQTELSPEKLLIVLQKIEAAHGRRREEHWGPRTLDLDLLLFDQVLLDTPALKIPHPGLYERNFVLYPLLEIEPQLQIPNAGPILDFVANCQPGDLQRIE